ncbi:MAG: Integral membrane protein MviN [Candidatus Magasanikbacteria bacterium GW2011_GWC2_37_14]|uniref:Probable lipid II flippase MurJ n=1 Tax=Candidatus Magasanikbacteria bacterium GW2011_GWC2_37_14 TaxID=1619046 RepID=A0A0G0IT36_9BACT|nr:MAG: Integral membrane protein MviN [Candidatus Magasanikbacteria bacterium GW2011_GWC2_37_14]
MFKKFRSETNSFTAAALILGAASFTSRFVGIIRDRIFAHQFGASDILDAYFSAFKIPDLLYILLISGALSVGLIPVFTKLLLKDKKEAWVLISNITNIAGIFLSLASFILIIFTPQLVPLVAPGFDAEKTKLTINMTRIMFLSPLFLGLSAIVGGVLQSLKNFLIYSLSPIFYNLGIILAAWFLVPMIGPIGLAWGVVFGAILHLAVQLPTFFKTGYVYKAIINFKDTNLRLIGRLMVPRILALSALQINLIVTTAIASTLSTGSITVFNYANNLQSFPLGLVGVSFAIAIFPTLSALAAQNKTADYIKNLSSAVRQILFFITPLTVIFLLLRAQIVRLLLGTGQFDWSATINTADTLAFFSLGFFAQALLPLLIRAYYALEDTKTPFLISLVSVTVNIGLSFLFTHGSYNLGTAGLALAYSLAGTLNAALLWVFLHLKTGGLDENRIITSIFKISTAGLFMGIVIQAGKYLIAPLVDMQTFLGIFIQGSATGIIGLLIYIIIGLLLKSHEMIVFVNTLKNKFIKTKNLPPDISGISEI